MSNESPDKHPQFDLTAQVYRGSAAGKLGSAYLIGPGLFLTALHCVIDGETVPAGEVTCEVRLFVDRPRKPGDPKWAFRSAMLVWPSAGASIKGIDVAIIMVDQPDRTAAMNQAPALATHIPQRPQFAEAVGYPKWRNQPETDQIKPHRARGRLESDQAYAGTLNDFDVAGSTPGEVEDWGGMSGSAVFARETNVCLGVVSTRDRSKNNSLLGATLFHDLAADDTFWTAAGLPKPTRGVSALRQARAPQGVNKQLPSAFLHLFDRKPQRDRWEVIVRSRPVADPHSVMIVPIIAAVEDEAGYLLRRLEAIVGSRFEPRKATYQNANTIGWVYDDVTPQEAADQMLLGMHDQLRIKTEFAFGDFSKNVVAFRAAIESGTVPRAFRLEMAAEDDGARARGILGALFECLAGLGTFDSPLVLFVSLDRNKLPADARAKPLEHDCIKQVEALVARFAALSWRTLSPLGPCATKDLDQWSLDLQALANPDLDLARLSTLKLLSEIHGDGKQLDQPFAFQKARFALEKLGL